MTHTPNLADENMLDALASRYVDVDTLPWKPTPTPGIDMKILMEEPESGLMTALFRWQPNTVLPLHEHVEIEQSYILQGSIFDEEGEAREGSYVWRPKGNRHIARSAHGALVLSFFIRPNRFVGGDLDGEALK